ETGSGSLFHYIEDIFGRGLSPEVILAPNRDLAEKIASRLRQRQFEEGESTDIAHVQTMHDFVPTHQIEKIQVLHALNQLIPPQIMSRLQGKEKTMAEALMDPPNFQVFNEQDLPDMIKSKFLEKDGSVGSLVMVDKKFAHDVDDANKTIDFVKEIRDVTDSVAPGAPVAGQMAINADMFQAVKVDGPKTTLVAFIAVVLLVVLLFRRVKTVTLCLFALCLGVAWMAGLALGFHIKINFLNFIALPITFGIGIDYGVNIFQRYQVEGRGSIINVIAETGAAVALCSFTTVVGYSSLLIAGNRAFVSFGLLAVIGEICCATAAIVSLPAFLQVMEQRLER
ncbi:MAG: MMPL family transporter, partial [Bdellovibrionota bacterium]